MSKRTLGTIVVLISVMLMVVGCTGVITGSDQVVEEARDVSGFNRVELALAADLIIELGEAESLTIEAEDNLLPYIETRVRGNTLEIGQRSGVILRSREPIRLYLTVTDLDGVGIAGSGQAEVPDLETEQLSIDISGSGEVRTGALDLVETLEVDISGSGELDVAELRAEGLDVDISGSGRLDIDDGEVETQDIEVSGSGRYSARRFESSEAEVDISGSGEVTIRVDERLRLEISGSGTVRYIGNPTVNQSISGSGSVEQIDE